MCSVVIFVDLQLAALWKEDFSPSGLVKQGQCAGSGIGPFVSQPNGFPTHWHIWSISYSFKLVSCVQNRFRPSVRSEYDDNYRSRSYCSVEWQKRNRCSVLHCTVSVRLHYTPVRVFDEPLVNRNFTPCVACRMMCHVSLHGNSQIEEEQFQLAT